MLIVFVFVLELFVDIFLYFVGFLIGQKAVKWAWI